MYGDLEGKIETNKSHVNANGVLDGRLDDGEVMGGIWKQRTTSSLRASLPVLCSVDSLVLDHTYLRQVLPYNSKSFSWSQSQISRRIRHLSAPVFSG